MEMPTLCPICHDIMATDFRLNDHGITKKCIKKLNHTIQLQSYSMNADEVQFIFLAYGKTKSNIFLWNLKTSKLKILYSHIDIPFFEPNFSNFNKLTNKLDTYIMFS